VHLIRSLRPFFSSGNISYAEQLRLAAIRKEFRVPRQSRKTFEAVARIDTPMEADYYRNGGILPYVLRQLAAK
jgi:aconitate hydratase